MKFHNLSARNSKIGVAIRQTPNIATQMQNNTNDDIFFLSFFIIRAGNKT